jgi:hypothetical protein
VKRKSLLVDELPSSFGGQFFNSSFKAVLKYFDIVEEKGDMEERARRVMDLFFPEGLPDGDPSGFIASFINPEEGKGGKKLFDFRHDSALIYASFMQTYGIDLIKNDLHWWEFLALFKGLTDDCIMRRVMDIRSKKINTKMSAEERQRIVRAQADWALPGSDEDTLFARFRRG